MRQFLLLLPGMVCLFWLVLYRIMSTRERVYRYAMFVLAIQSVYYFAAVMPLVVTDVARTVVICTLLEHAFGLVSIPALLSYLYVMRGRTESNPLLRLCYYLPVILVFAECVIIWIIGFGNATQFVMDINSGKLTGFSLEDRSQEMLYFCLVIGFKVIIGMVFNDFGKGYWNKLWVMLATDFIITVAFLSAIVSAYKLITKKLKATDHQPLGDIISLVCAFYIMFVL